MAILRQSRRLFIWIVAQRVAVSRSEVLVGFIDSPYLIFDFLKLGFRISFIENLVGGFYKLFPFKITGLYEFEFLGEVAQRILEIRFRRSLEGGLKYLENTSETEILGRDIAKLGSVRVSAHTDHGCVNENYPSRLHIGLMILALASTQMAGYPKSNSYQRVAKFNLRGYLW